MLLFLLLFLRTLVIFLFPEPPHLWCAPKLYSNVQKKVMREERNVMKEEIQVNGKEGKG